MKKINCLFLLVLACCYSLKAQNSTLVVDNQTPGWLSSKINYGDQLTVQNLTVTGYINGTDIKFIRELNTNRSLHGVIDLANANIVSGGEAYYYENSYASTGAKYTQDNMITSHMFSYLDSIQKLILPHSLDSVYLFDQRIFVGTPIDTLIVNGRMKYFSGFATHDNYGIHIKYLKLPDTVCELILEYFFYDNKTRVLVLPLNLEEIYIGAYSKSEHVIYSNIKDPTHITIRSSSGVGFNNGRIYVPKGTTDLYKKSIFRSLTIIEMIEPDSIDIKESNIILYKGDTYVLNADVYPKDVLNKTINWISRDTNIVGINANGEILAKSYGSTYIVVKTHDNMKADSCFIETYDHTTAVSISNSSLQLKIGDKEQLTAQTLPLGTSDGQITWSSSDEDVATVDEDGNVKGIAKGACTIVATSVDGGYTKECVVTVVQPVQGLQLEKHEINLKVGESEELRVQITPNDANNKNIQWTSEDEAIATVNEEGVVTGVKAGKGRIYATSEENSEISDYCTVTITQSVTGISLDKQTVELTSIGETVQLQATVLPEDASNTNIRWSSSNEAVCRVANNGLVFALSDGIAVIVATTEDGGYLAICQVTVNTASGIESITEHPISIRILDGMVYVQNKPKDKEMSIYTLDGVLRYKGTDNRVWLPNGMYLIKIGNLQEKVVVSQ